MIMKNLAIQKAVNNLDKARVIAIDAHWSIRDKAEAKVDRLYDSVAAVAKRQGFSKLNGSEFISSTEIDIDTINYIMSN